MGEAYICMSGESGVELLRSMSISVSSVTLRHI